MFSENLRPIKIKKIVLSTAVRIRIDGVQLPPPTNENLESMARAYYEQSRQLWRVLKNRDLPDYEALDDETKEIQISGMRASYAALAVRGGAAIEKIKNIDLDAQQDKDSQESE